MHVLILCEYGTINGGENSLLAVLDHRPANTHVTVLAPPDGRLAHALRERDVSHVPFSVHGSNGDRLSADEVLDRLTRETLRLSPDVVHANSLSMGRLTGQLASRVPTACTAHLRDIIRISATAAGHLNGNQQLIAVSEATRNFHVSQGLEAERVDVLYNGIDCDRWQPRPREGWLRDQLRLPSQTILAATIGQIGLRKGLDVLVNAAVLNARQLPQLHYLVAGERHSSKQESIAFERSLHETLRAESMADRFHWLGYRDDVDRLLNEVDLLIHPARQEPFGRVLLEAAACGLPIVATRAGGTAEMLTGDASALLVEPGDTGALAESVGRLATNVELRRALGQSARIEITQRFEIKQCARDLFTLWRSLGR